MKNLDILPVNDLYEYIALFMQLLNDYGHCEKFEYLGFTCICYEYQICVYNVSMIKHYFNRSHLENVINTKIFDSEEDNDE